MRLIGSLIAVVMVAGATTIDVVPSLGPNANFSPSFPAYTDNALTGLRAGTAGIGSGPSYYGIDYTFTFEDATVTNYPSWRGVAYPDPPYDAELGNSYFVGVHILADANVTFHLSDVRVWRFSTIIYPLGDWWQWAYDLSTATLAGMRGYLDGVEVPLALDSDIDELVYVGIAGGFDAGTDKGFGSGQAGLDDAIAQYRAAFGEHMVTTCYALGGTVNGTTSNGGITDCSEQPPVPEPVTFVLGGAGLLGLLLLRRRR
ncbi:MAG: hypothetical protein ABSD56_09030 [Bryobacteraceae bacterium]